MELCLSDVPWFVLRVAYTLCFTMYSVVMTAVRTVLPPTGKDIRGQHVLVTGAGGALGRELALQLAREGCRLTCVDVNVPECEETVRLVSRLAKGAASCHRLDVSDRHAVAEFAKKLEADASLDILINNAGIVQAGGLLSVSDDQISKIIDVNLMAHFWTVRAFLPGMLKRDCGHIVAISSAAALAGAANIAPYTASKAGVSALMECLREELKLMGSNVKTTTMQPYFLKEPRDKRHWEKRSLLADVAASTAALRTVQAIKRDAITVTIPSRLFIYLNAARMLPAAAVDRWKRVLDIGVIPREDDSNSTARDSER